MWFTIFWDILADCEQCTNGIYFICSAEILQKYFCRTWKAHRNCIPGSWNREWNWCFKQLDGIIKTKFFGQVTGMGIFVQIWTCIVYNMPTVCVLAFITESLLICILLIRYWCLYTSFIPLFSSSYWYERIALKACTILANVMKFALIEVFQCQIT